MNPSTGSWGVFGRSSPYVGDAAGSSCRLARDRIATFASAGQGDGLVHLAQEKVALGRAPAPRALDVRESSPTLHAIPPENAV